MRKTFGQPVDPETLDDPIWGTRTLLALIAGQREGARLFMQRCNVCHGATMNSMDAYAEPAGPPAEVADAVRLAWERTLAFLR